LTVGSWLVPDVSQDPVFVRLPGDLVQDGLLAEVPSAKRVPDLRGPVLNEVVTVVSDVVSITSGLVTIGVAHDQIGALAKRIVALLRRRHEAAPAQPTFRVEVMQSAGPTVVIWVGRGGEADRELTDALRQVSGSEPG
jgi:hypothetical protein